MGLLKQLGCQVIDLGIIEDDETKMMQVLEQAAKQADVVITSGGVSVGDADFIKSALEKLGQIDFGGSICVRAAHWRLVRLQENLSSGYRAILSR